MTNLLKNTSGEYTGNLSYTVDSFLQYSLVPLDTYFWDNSLGITLYKTLNGTIVNPYLLTSGTGTVTSIATAAPITGGPITTTGTIGITQSTASTDGYLSSTDWNTFNGKGMGTVTSVDLTPGVGISVSGGPITSFGSITVVNTAPDQVVVLTNGIAIAITGTYPNFTVTNTAPDQTVVLSNGAGISVTGTYPNFTITNTSPSSGGTVTSIATNNGITGGTITSTGTIGLAAIAANSVLANLTAGSAAPSSALAYTASGTVSTLVFRDASGNFSVNVITANSIVLANNAQTTLNIFQTLSTIARTWTMPDLSGTVALTSQLTSGTVTTVSIVTANGVSGSVATATTTPAITLTLGAITPSSVNGNTITTGTGTLILSTFTLTVSGTASISGTNTGDQTITLTGDVTGSGTGSFAATIANNAVTYAKMQAVSTTNKLLGSSSTTTPVQEITIGTGLTLTGTTLTASGSGGTFTVNFNGYGGVVSINTSALLASVSKAGTITSWSILGDTSGSCVIDMLRWNGSSYVSIIGSGNKPTLSSATRGSASVSGWTSTSISINDEFKWNVDSCSVLTQINVEFFYT